MQPQNAGVRSLQHDLVDDLAAILERLAFEIADRVASTHGRSRFLADAARTKLAIAD